MLSKKMQDALNKQINAELYSSYLYQSMAYYFDSIYMPGMSSWMHLQAGEERGHAGKFAGFVSDRGGRVVLAAIDAPPKEWDSPLAAFKAAYEHEQKVTGMIHKLVELAAAEKDHAAGVMLNWFVSEQVEEEATAEEIVAQLEMIGDSKNGQFMMDHRLGKRGQSS